jgi:hypothetical protein
MSGTGAQEGTKIAEWKADIERILANSADKAPGDLIEELCGLATAMGDDAAEEVLAANPGLFNHADALKRANFERIIRQDVNETRRLLAGTWASRVRFPDVASPRRVLSYNRSREMFDLIDFRDCQRAVMVGCGSLPFTMYHIEDRTDVPDIVGLDILPDAIATAKELSEKLGYARVRFELHDGQTYDFRDAQVVYIASTVTPKRAVMSRIAETASAGTRIISRDPYSLARLWVEDSEGHRDPRIDVAGHGDGIWSLTRDVYFRRRSNSGAATLNR